MLLDGVSSLNDTELLAVLIGEWKAGKVGRNSRLVAGDDESRFANSGKLSPEGYAQIPE